MATANLRKAAVLVMSLPEPQAAKLLGLLTPEQAAALSGEMARLRGVARQEQEAVIREFAAAGCTRAARGGQSHFRGNTANPESNNLLAAKIGTVPSVPSTQTAPLRFLQNVGMKDLLALLADEHPQTIALILSQLSAEQAAAAIDSLAPERQAAVLSRIAAMDPPSREIVQDVAAGVGRRLGGVAGGKLRAGLAKTVKMLNAMKPATERKLLGHIAEADPNLLGEIRRAMFGADVAACGQWDLAGAAS